MKRFAVAWRGLIVGAITLSIAACGGDEDSPSPPAATVVTETQAPATTTPAPEPTPSPTVAPAASPTPEQIAPRAASYADLLFTVTEVVESNETWRSYGGTGTREQSNDQFLYVHMDVSNQLTLVQLGFDSELFRLSSDGSEIEAVRLWSQATNQIVSPGQSVPYITGFQVPDGFDVASAELVLAESGKAPASIVLSGTPEKQPYPIEVEVLDEASPVSAGTGCDDLRVDPHRAAIDLDAGIDGSGISGSVEGGRRAQVDQRFLRIDFRVTAGARDCAVRAEFFRVQVDGEALEPASRMNTTLTAGTSFEFSLAYRIPVDAEDIVLLAGEADGNVKPFPVVVSDFGP